MQLNVTITFAKRNPFPATATFSEKSSAVSSWGFANISAHIGVAYLVFFINNLTFASGLKELASLGTHQTLMLSLSNIVV
ncbi:MAG: hypothetical protein PHQ11_00900 [Paludibacter sp.]|nr:hypothetical protein [Paludibacter sp.]MDD4198407.1 hypothetical protein [Paludibacter sp.]MDD4427085.1 hypothetical protein [Paludibacter sp.]